MDNTHKVLCSEQDLRPVGLTQAHSSVQQVNGGSKAEQADLQPGDIIMEINGENTADMLNVEAQNKIKNSKTQLQLMVERYTCSSAMETNIPATMTSFMLCIGKVHTLQCYANFCSIVPHEYLKCPCLCQDNSFHIFLHCFQLYHASTIQTKTSDCNQGKCQHV